MLGFVLFLMLNLVFLFFFLLDATSVNERVASADRPSGANSEVRDEDEINA